MNSCSFASRSPAPRTRGVRPSTPVSSASFSRIAFHTVFFSIAISKSHSLLADRCSHLTNASAQSSRNCMHEECESF